MPVNTSKLIRSKIEQYADDPVAQSNNVKLLKGENDIYRLRDWRILFTKSNEAVAVIKIASRGTVYEG
jgi:mRNA interferase RelE/StbE